ncbi:Nucleolar pre-ribosomal-associated 1,N-terminal [Chlorella sorokiniana]|uniref:Nucleolar pre-ribosomal-associated 1,N-terminal n=1 Tax=Chlorella sorokiniana TaxID=3076 RepID=A0A2P6TUM4_CHLSO|nr:Nucleolar pre-ribosomal-associated 1,N-terminal [Chlorella sorokiniana]|eukprot:PRW57763.1 Nucleolar pre-ribosomal-associated 1,N-terminal [Chlorella sorokiniana]
MDEFAMYEGLRATRDADSCLAGLNKFRAALRGDGGPAFLARYLRQSPEWQELQNVWDAQLTIQHYHVTVTLLLALADALGMAAAAASGRQPAGDEEDRRVLAAGAATLSSSILQRRLKALYFALSSDVRGKANAALALLAATAGACAGGAAGGSGAAGTAGTAAAPSLRELVRAFDWSLSALPGLARPPREKKGESPAEHRRRYWQQWALGDPLKRPTRALFCQLAAALLRAAGSGPAADALLLQQLVQLRPLVGGLLQHLAADPPAHQLQVLQLLQKRVLAPKAGVPPAVQAEAFSDAALQQLATIATTAAVEGEEAEAEEEEEEAGGSGPAGGSSPERQAAAAAALEVLLAVATDPAHGLAAPAAVTGQFVLADVGSHQLLPGQRRLLRLLLRLRPADSAAHLQLLLAAAAADAPLAAALLLALPYSLEPAAAGAAAPASAAGRWFAHAAVASRLLQLLPAAAQPGLQLAASSGGGAPAPGGRRAQALLRCCFPPCLHKAALSRGMQHTNALVRYGTLGLLLSAMSALDAVLTDCSAAAQAAAAAGAAGAQRRQGWLALRRWLQQAARQQLPDPTLLLALLAAAEKEGWEAANELQLTAVLRLLLLWQRLLPAALAEANVDAERLMPAQPLALRPQHQLLLLELLHAAADAAAASAADATGSADGSTEGAGVPAAATAGASLLPPLRLLVGSPAAAVRAEAHAWLLRRLLATGAFGGNEEEACLWLDLLPRGGEAVCGFLSEAVQLLLRRPHELLEQQQLLLAEAPPAAPQGQQGHHHQQQQQQQFSLLALCTLRQLLRVLPSAKIAAADKAATAAYVAAVLQQLMQQQLGGPAAAAALAAVLLGTVRQEAARQQQQQQQARQQGETGAADGAAQEPKSSKKDKKRKHAAEGSSGEGSAAATEACGPLQLPLEGRPLLGLLAELESLLSPGQAAAGEAAEGEEGQRPNKKKKKSKEAASGAAGKPAPCSVAVIAEPGGSPAEAAAEAAAAAAAGSEACCLLVSQLASSSSSKLPRLLANVQLSLAADAASSSGSSGGGSGASTCSAAVRQCLCLVARPDAAESTTAALLQALQAAVLAAAGGSNQQALARCMHLLAGSTQVAAALANNDASELATAVAQLLHQLLTRSNTPACSRLLQQVSAAFVQLVAAGAGSQQPSGDELPPAASRFLLLLPHLPADALEAAADAVLTCLSAASSTSSTGKKKSKKEGAAKQHQADAAQPWLAAAAAAVLQQLVSRGSLGQQPQRLAQVCALLVQLAGGSGGSSGLFSCLLQLLCSKQTGAAALAAMGSAGRQQLLRSCLAAPAAGGLAARSQAAAVLVEQCSECCQLAADLLLSLLDGCGAASLALALPAATALLTQQQQQQRAAEGEQQVGQGTAAALAGAVQQQLLSHFTVAAGGQAEEQPAKKQKKKRSSDAAGASADAAAEEAAAAAAALRQQHGLPCLRLTLQMRPLAVQQRQQLLAALLPEQGWQVTAPTARSGSAAQLGAAEQAEAAVLLLTAGSSPTTEELAACVRCFAATLASILKQPAGGPQAALEQRLFSLLDGPVGDAVAALPASQRGTAAFAELASAAAGTLGTAVLRHRLATDAAGGSEAAAAVAGVAAMRVVRRFMAALLPEEEEAEGSSDGSSSSSGSDDEDSSSDDDSDSDTPAGRRASRQQAAAQLSSPKVAAAALQLLQRLLGHSRFLPAMRAVGASPPPLPAAAQAQARPLVSLLPLAAATDGGTAPEAAPSAAAAAAAMKKELCELLETLLDLHQRFSSGSPPPAERQQVAAAESALLPLLMAGYGASCSPTDCAMWSLAAAINRRQWERQQAAPEGDAEAANLAALVHGPLSQSCFAWGPAAAAMQQLQPGAGDEEQQAQRRQLLQQRLPLDSLRAALTVCHWPEACALAAPGSSSAPEDSTSSAIGGGSGGGSSSSPSSGQLAQLPGCAAAYDPGFLLPFAICCLRQQLLAPRAFVEAGLLSVCLRALASADAGCRAAAYQALALFEAQLPAGGAGAAAHGFKEAQQLSVLLGALRAAVTRPFHRLPAVTAAFLAEAALLPPGAAMYPGVHKQLTRRAVLSTAEVPLLGQLLLAGGQQHAAERRWLLQLLLAGLRSSQDASLYRRKHAFEMAMALHDSCVVDPAAAALALRLLCSATYIPRAARQLAQESGLISWLASAAEAALQQQAQPGLMEAAQRQGGAGASGAVEGLSTNPAAVAQEALAALRRLLQLRAVMRGSGGMAAAQEMAAAACRLAGAVLAAAAAGGTKTVALKLGQQVLPFLLDVQQHASSSSSRGQPSKQAGLASSRQADLAAAVDSLQALLGAHN